MDAQTEGERRPMNRDPGQQVLVDNQPQDPQRRMPDTSYPRSTEGILRMCAVPVALTGIVLAVFGNTAGIFFIFVGIAFLIYIGLVFIVEVFVPGIYIHRLVDAIICMIFCTLWLVAAIIVTVYAVQWEIAALQGAAFIGYILMLMSCASAFFAHRTWNRTKKGSRPVIV
ncbi:hypothetical protein GBAR_LOCUS9208 [Geodia barretti]|uniref:MARVEL domain-containing protein n=1 Tax=Geodia barretti TaxID=519541 RepID=A0AA35WBV0_GEOBA|nr:hypothetical protein GBAR_LOCUS9208 [Geodia barretti]